MEHNEVKSLDEEAIAEAEAKNDEARGRFKTACEHVKRAAHQQRKRISGEQPIVRRPDTDV